MMVQPAQQGHTPSHHQGVAAKLQAVVDSTNTNMGVAMAEGLLQKTGKGLREVCYGAVRLTRKTLLHSFPLEILVVTEQKCMAAPAWLAKYNQHKGAVAWCGDKSISFSAVALGRQESVVRPRLVAQQGSQRGAGAPAWQQE